jgi:DNA-directed RNA polymerase subunit RPC12/RpoP
MKIKFPKFEFEFGKEDAEIVVPLVLLGVSFFAIPNYRGILFVITTIYFLILLLCKIVTPQIKLLILKRRLKCPVCKSRLIILEGLRPYNSGVEHEVYKCTECQKYSIMTEGGLKED